MNIIRNHLIRLYLLHTSSRLTPAANIFACFQLNIVHPLFFWNSSNLDVMSSVVKFMTGLLFWNKSTGIIESGIWGMISTFANDYFIIVHNKTILNTVDKKTVFDEMWYIIEYFIISLFSFLVVFDWENQSYNNFHILFLNSKEP